MKIAIPSDDQVTVAPHFGRTLGFNVYTIENNEIKSSEYRSNTFTGHAQNEQNVQHVHDHSHSQGEHNHSHSKIMDSLGDCEIVIAGGMGRRLYVDFENAKKQVFVTKEKHAETAVKMFLEETLDNNKDATCQH